MVEQAIRQYTSFRGLRRFDAARDLGQVAGLIRVAFAEELEPGEIGMLQEMHALQALAPLLWLASRISVEFQETFGGFVWIEDGRVVGNVTVSRTGPDAHDWWSRRVVPTWLISNVVVDPAYRRRGIARELMTAALQGLKPPAKVHLQVRHTNIAAQALYRQLGFILLDSITELRLAGIAPISIPPAEGFQLQPWDTRGARRAYELARATVPEAWQHCQPLRFSDFEPPGLPGRILEWLRGQHSRYWAVSEGDTYVATLVVQAALRGGSHELKLMVRPDWQGRVEEHLVAFGLAALRTLGDRPVQVKVPTGHATAISALQRHGFVVVRSLDRLGLEKLVSAGELVTRQGGHNAGIATALDH
jgi:ribosomal protein S18 acetylase RimI-like enzyme